MRPTRSGSPGGALQAVREATRDAHDAVDGLLPHGLRRLDDYRRYLSALLPLVEWLARGWHRDWPARLGDWRDSHRLAGLEHDLAALGLDSTPGTPLAATPRPGTPAAWLGGCYVLEGSALGARLLARDLDALAGSRPEVGGARRFIDHITAEPARWRRFTRQLDALPAPQVPAAAAGARAGFAIVHAGLVAGGGPR